MVTLTNGLATFRTYDKIAYFKKTLSYNANCESNSSFSHLITLRYSNLRMDIVVLFFVTAVAAFAIGCRNILNKGYLSVSIAIITDLIGAYSVGFRMFMEVQSMMTSYKRIQLYTQI